MNVIVRGSKLVCFKLLVHVRWREGVRWKALSVRVVGIQVESRSGNLPDTKRVWALVRNIRSYDF